MGIRYIFNTNGIYVAFIQNNYLFSPECEWLGVVINNEVYDVSGKYIGTISSDDRIIRDKRNNPPKIAKPMKPMKPLKPLKPLKRLRMNRLPFPYEDALFNKPTITNSISKPNIDHFINAEIYAQDNTFLGKINSNKYDQNSILNKYGNYGSRYSETSIFNQYGSYGSKYSQLSPSNQYSNTPPILKKNGQVLGYLTVNQYLNPRLDFVDLLKWVESVR